MHWVDLRVYPVQGDRKFPKYRCLGAIPNFQPLNMDVANTLHGQRDSAPKVRAIAKAARIGIATTHASAGIFAAGP